MKRITVAIVILIMSTLPALADIIPGGNKEGFMGNTSIQWREVGEETFIEEFVLPISRDPLPDKTLRLWIWDDFVFTAEKDEVDFTCALQGDKRWEISSLIMRGRWNHIWVRVEGKWNPALDGTDKLGRSLVVRVGVVPFKKAAVTLYHKGPFDIIMSIPTKAAPPQSPPQFTLKPPTEEMAKDLENAMRQSGLSTTTTTTTWGSIKKGF